MKKWGGELWGFLKKHRWSVLLLVLALIISGLIIWDSFSASTDSPVMGKLRPKPAPTTMAAPISGLQVLPEVVSKRPVGIVVENYIDARPQSGLNQADLVYETFAEGGITRFLAIYQSRDSKEIGPVRSARPYFVEWAASYEAIFAHAGGSEDALTLIPKSKVYDLNQFTNAKAFWRDNARYAPHNVYTSLERIYTAATTKKWPLTDDSIPAFSFKKEAEATARPTGFAVKVIFNGPYAVTWEYQPKENNFYRLMSGIPQRDRNTKEQIRAKNLVICFSDFSYGTQSSGKEKVNIRTTGTGQAFVYIDGNKVVGKWRRPFSSDITRFYDATGTELKLNPGTTWVEFVPQGTKVN